MLRLSKFRPHPAQEILRLQLVTGWESNMGRHHHMFFRFCSFYQDLDVCHWWRETPGARWLLSVHLGKKGGIFKGLDFLGLPSEASLPRLYFLLRDCRGNRRCKEINRENEKGFGLKNMSLLCSSQGSSERWFVCCPSCYFSSLCAFC